MPVTPPHDSGRNASRDPGRSRQWSRQALAFALAFLLPILSSAITARVPFLHLVPFALHFICMALIATLGGLVPALTAVLVSVLSHNYYLDKTHFHWILTWSDAVRSTVLLVSAVLISLMNRRRQQASDKLEVLLYALQERTDVLVQSLHNSRCASWTLDLARDEAIHWYSGSYQIFGQPFEQNQSLESFRLLLYPDDQPKLSAVLDQMRTSADPIAFEFRVPWPNGELHWLECRGTRTPGHACLWRGVTVDVTDRKLAEAALLRAEKLAAMGRLASTIAHEINNPLEAVTNLLFLIAGNPALANEIRPFVELAQGELQRVCQIATQTLRFHRQAARATLVTAQEIVDAVLNLYQGRLTNSNIRVDVRYHCATPILCFENDIRQVLNNLIANAIDAMRQGGSLLIRAHDATEPATKASFSTPDQAPFGIPASGQRSSPRRGVRITVADTGHGMSPSVRARVFEPFYTTKDLNGTGLGLWISGGIIARHHGRISLRSSDHHDHHGTVFSIFLPHIAEAQIIESDTLPA
jgi:signal transduction histidine kinase